MTRRRTNQKAKEFGPGEAVEVRRAVGAEWEPALYDKPRFGQERAGWHIVKLVGAPRVVDVLGKKLALDWVSVPSVRIRPAAPPRPSAPEPES